MSKDENSGVVIFTILNSELERLEKSTFEASLHQYLALAREKMLNAMNPKGSSRYDLGLAVRDYRAFYKQRAEKTWRDEAGAKIASALGYKHLKSVNGLIDDAELADKLGDELRDAMVAHGYDPAERKNKDFVTCLLRDDPRLQTPGEAAKLVDQEIARRSEIETGPATTEVQQKLVRRIANLVLKQPREARGTKLREIFDQAKSAVQAGLTKAAGDVENKRGASVRVAHAGTMKRQGTVADSKSAGSALPNQEESASIAREVSAGSVPDPKHLHPWGDACLNTFQILNSEPDSRRLYKFDRKLLYGVRDNTKPTIYLVGGLLDLFDPRVDDGLVDEHLNVFQDAWWHTFLALTPQIDSVQRHWQRRKLMNRDLGFPVNLWIGATIDRVEHLERMRILHETGMSTPWASFVGYRSDQSHPLSGSSLLSDINRFAPRLVVFGWDFAKPQPDLTVEDARTLADAAARPEFCGTHFFFTHPESRRAFLNGIPLPTVSSSATQSVLHAEHADELLDWAEQLRHLPCDWFRTPSPPELQFDDFEGAAVETFVLMPQVTIVPIAMKGTS